MENFGFSSLIKFLLSLKIPFIVLSLLFLIGTIFFLFRTCWLKDLIIKDLIEFFTFRAFGIGKVGRKWLKIIKRLETTKEAEYKLAIIEADSLLENIFERMGFFGKTFEEKLRKPELENLIDREKILEAHQIRDNIIHDPDYRLSLEEAKKIIEIYKKTLEDLQAL